MMARVLPQKVGIAANTLLSSQMAQLTSIGLMSAWDRTIITAQIVSVTNP